LHVIFRHTVQVLLVFLFAEPLVIVPAEQVVSVRRGSTALLRVNIGVGIPLGNSFMSITWLDPRKRRIYSSSRYSLMESNHVLIIGKTKAEDNGTYMIVINQFFLGKNISASTVITLNVQSKFNATMKDM